MVKKNRFKEFLDKGIADEKQRRELMRDRSSIHHNRDISREPVEMEIYIYRMQFNKLRMRI